MTCNSGKGRGEKNLTTTDNDEVQYQGDLFAVGLGPLSVPIIDRLY